MPREVIVALPSHMDLGFLVMTVEEAEGLRDRLLVALDNVDHVEEESNASR